MGRITHGVARRFARTVSRASLDIGEGCGGCGCMVMFVIGIIVLKMFTNL